MTKDVKKSQMPVWNLHTRLFHIALASLTIIALALGIIGDDDWMIWHFRCGYTLLGLIVFRLVIGFFSGDYARFSHSPINPLRIRDYLKGEKFAGHNPIGIWMIVMLLVAITIQSLSGLFTTDGFWLEGPWVNDASDATISFAGKIHSYGQVVFFTLIGLHIGGNIITALWKKQGSLLAMISGKKQFPADTQFQPAQKTSWFALTFAILLAVLAAWLASNPF